MSALPISFHQNLIYLCNAPDEATFEKRINDRVARTEGVALQTLTLLKQLKTNYERTLFLNVFKKAMPVLLNLKIDYDEDLVAILKILNDMTPNKLTMALPLLQTLKNNSSPMVAFLEKFQDTASNAIEKVTQLLEIQDDGYERAVILDECSDIPFDVLDKAMPLLLNIKIVECQKSLFRLLRSFPPDSLDAILTYLNFQTTAINLCCPTQNEFAK